MSLNGRKQLTLASGGEFWKEGMVCAEAQGSNDVGIFLEKKEDSRATYFNHEISHNPSSKEVTAW